MAKSRTGLDALFKKTEGEAVEAAVEVPAEGRTIAVGVGLKESEIALLDQVAGDLGVARNAVTRYAVRYFLTAYLRGDVDMTDQVEAKTKKSLRMP